MFLPLAAINFANPLMLIGLLAAVIPLALHLLNRIRSPIVPFPTLRFLQITVQKTARRRHIQQWFLLLLRMSLFALIAITIAGPLIPGGNPILAYALLALLLVGLALLAAALILLINTLRNPVATSPPASTSEITKTQKSNSKNSRPSHALSFSAILFLLALAATAYALFGLAGDSYFSGALRRYSGSSTACVIIFDNSHSMLARENSTTRLQKAKDQVRQLLTAEHAPAEIAVLPTNPAPDSPPPTADRLTTDATAILGTLDSLSTTGRAQPYKPLIRQALNLLATSSQPNKMLIILSDMARPNFTDAAVFSAVQDLKDSRNLQIVLMPQSNPSPPADVGITNFSVDSGVPVVGGEIIFAAQLINNGDGASVSDLQLLVDDNVIPSVHPRVQLGPAGTAAARSTIKIAYRVAKSGSHRFSLELRDKADALEWDNQRQLILNIADQVKVLIIGPEAVPRPRTTAHFVATALDPFHGASNLPVANPSPWSIAPNYQSIDRTTNLSLAPYAAVFLCDVPKISPIFADALAKYANRGGRIIFLLGPAVDATSYNAELLRGGGGDRNLLPSPLAEPIVTATGSTVDYVDLTSAIFANLFDSQDPFRQIVITGRWSLAGDKVLRGHPLSKLTDGSPFITQHLLGSGQVYTLLSSPSAGWSNMATTVAFLPMLSRMALGDIGRNAGDGNGGAGVSQSSYEPGNQVFIPVPSDDSSLALDVLNPKGQTINVPATRGPPPSPALPTLDSPTWSFLRTAYDGVYTWQSADKKLSGQFVINPPAEEADLLPADLDALAKEPGTMRPVIIAPTVPELLAQLNQQAEGISLAPGVLTLVLVLVLLEALLANRQSPSTAPGSSPGPRHLALINLHHRPLGRVIRNPLPPSPVTPYNPALSFSQESFVDLTVYYYSYSTIAQTLAGAFGFLAAIVLYRLQALNDQLRGLADHLMGDPRHFRLEPYRTLYIHHNWPLFLTNLERDADPVTGRPEFQDVNFLDLGAMRHTSAQVSEIRFWFILSMAATVTCIACCLITLCSVPWYSSPALLVSMLVFGILCLGTYGRLVYTVLRP